MFFPFLETSIKYKRNLYNAALVDHKARFYYPEIVLVFILWFEREMSSRSLTSCSDLSLIAASGWCWVLLRRRASAIRTSPGLGDGVLPSQIINTEHSRNAVTGIQIILYPSFMVFPLMSQKINCHFIFTLKKGLGKNRKLIDLVNFTGRRGKNMAVYLFLWMKSHADLIQ